MPVGYINLGACGRSLAVTTYGVVISPLFRDWNKKWKHDHVRLINVQMEYEHSWQIGSGLKHEGNLYKR